MNSLPFHRGSATLLASFGLIAGCAAPGGGLSIALESPAAGVARASDSGTFSVKPLEWLPVGRAGSEFLMEISIVNNRSHAALLSPDSLVAELRPDAGGRPRISRPVDFWERQARLVEEARREHDPSNPYHPDVVGFLVHGLARSKGFDSVEAAYHTEKWNAAEWDRKNGGQVEIGDPALMGWRNHALRDTVLWSHWELKRWFAVPADTSDGVLVFRLRFGGLTDSVVFRQRVQAGWKR